MIFVQANIAAMPIPVAAPLKIASAAFLAGKKKFGKRTTLRPQAVYDEVARQVLADRGLKSPLGKIDGVPLSEYRP